MQFVPCCMGKVIDTKTGKGMEVKELHSFYLAQTYSNSEKDETSASNSLPLGHMTSCF